MLQLYRISTNVEETEYTLEYVMTKNSGTYEWEQNEEYGVICTLFGQEGQLRDREEIKRVTPDYGKMEEILKCLVKNQVFPVHVKEIVSDLLEMQLERSA